MKYHLHVNQERALSLGVTNINQAMILDLLCSASTWAQATIFNGEVYYWVARQKVCSELKILSLKPDTVYRHLVDLRNKGLIDYEKDDKKDLIRLTSKGQSYYVGNESEETRKQIRESSEMNPTYTTTIDPINHIIKKEKIYKKEKSSAPKQPIPRKHPKFDFKKELLKLGCDKQSVEDWLQARKKKKASNTLTALTSFKKEVEKANISYNEAVTIAAENSWAGFKASWVDGNNSDFRAKAQQSSSGIMDIAEEFLKE